MKVTFITFTFHAGNAVVKGVDVLVVRLNICIPKPLAGEFWMFIDIRSASCGNPEK